MFVQEERCGVSALIKSNSHQCFFIGVTEALSDVAVFISTVLAREKAKVVCVSFGEQYCHSRESSGVTAQ